MPFIVTPQKLASQADLYHQLGSLLVAGVPVIQALEIQHKSPPARHLKKPLAGLLHQLSQGFTLGESLLRSDHPLPPFDLALIRAGEESGRLDFSFKLLAHYYSERARLARTIISGVIYPALTLHLALLIFPLHYLTGLVWEGQLIPFLLQKLSVFLPIYGVIFLLIYACQGRHGESWRSFLERSARFIPLLGAARRHLALARLSAALEGLISAGVSIIEAWQLAAQASGSPALRKTVASWKPSLVAGQPPSELVRQSPAFPELFSSLYHSGEISGQLDETLRRLYTHYQEEGSRKLELAAQWGPRLLYFGILIAIAYTIISFWTSYYSDMMNVF